MTEAHRNPKTLLRALREQIADLDTAIGSEPGRAEVTHDLLIGELASVAECLKLVSECLESLGREANRDEASCPPGWPEVNGPPPPARDADSSADFLGGALAEDGEI